MYRSFHTYAAVALFSAITTIVLLLTGLLPHADLMKHTLSAITCSWAAYLAACMANTELDKIQDKLRKEQYAQEEREEDQ